MVSQGFDEKDITFAGHTWRSETSQSGAVDEFSEMMLDICKLKFVFQMASMRLCCYASLQEFEY